MSRVSSLDPNYQIGDLSVFPETFDDNSTLYTAVNNAECVLTQSLGYIATSLIVSDTSAFPFYGLLRISSETSSNYELVYYSAKTNTTFLNLQRGFAGSGQNTWPSQTSYISAAVMADYHNAILDATYNIEQDLGLIENPSPTSLNGILTVLENQQLTPRPFFRCHPLITSTNSLIRFQNFSNANAVRFLWDFGDGITSEDINPEHSYLKEGNYTIKLNVITTTGAQSSITKINYITISNDNEVPFFYVVPDNTNNPNYSTTTATKLSTTPQIFDFVDQTSGNITQRYWVFDDGITQLITDVNVMSIQHIYENPGTYNPSLIVVFATGDLKRVLTSSLIVL